MQELQDIYRLQAFVAVVDEGSLSAAVNKLHVTQPALSARLKLLEESVGCLLLERTGRGVRPTPIGKLVYAVAVDILRKMDSLRVTVKNHLELREGFVHLGGGATAVFGIFPDAIQEFRKTHGHIQFTLDEEDTRTTIDAVKTGALDIGIVTRNEVMAREEDPELEGLVIHLEVKDRLVLVASEDHMLARMQTSLLQSRKRLLPMHLNKQAMISFEKGSTIQANIESEFRRRFVHPRVVMTLRSTQSMLRMVEKNIGISVVSKLSLTREAQVVILEVEGLEMSRNLLVVSSEDRTLPPAASAFLQTLLKFSASKCEVVSTL